MPKVPGEVVPFKPVGAPAPQLDPTAVWMAAAMMHNEGKFQVAANEPPKDDVKPLRIVPGGGNTSYEERKDGRWMQKDTMGPIGLMPKGWSPSPPRAPGY